MADEKKTAKAATTDTEDGGADDAAEKMAVETEQGFRGTAVDPTPNENYTVAGVTAGKPTPETDAKAAAKAREQSGR